LLSQIISACGKDSPYIVKIVLAGVTNSLLRHDNSGLNNIFVFGITDDEFARSFGFTEHEIKEMLN
jgi:hypothetical protein